MAKFNKSTTYILPIFLDHLVLELSLDEDFVVNNILKHIKQTYIYNNNNNKAFIIELNKDIGSLVFLEIVQNSCIFEKAITTDNNIIIFFSITEDCIDTINKFISGRYSQICEFDKQSILAFARDRFSDDVYNMIEGVLYKNKSLIEIIKKEYALDYFGDDWECGSIINIEHETYIE